MKRKRCDCSCSGKQPPWIALVLIGIGCLFLLDNFGLLDIGDVWRFWPVILIAIGVAKLRTGRQEERASAYVFLCIGCAFLLAYLHILDWGIIWSFWPLILILIGISILLRHKERPQNTHSHHWFSATAVFGGVEKIVTYDKFEGGEVSSIFGECKIDFGRAQLAKGDNVLEILTLFGGTEITVPENWNVVVQTTPVFGGFEDRRQHMQSRDLPEDRKLIIKGIVLFGGLELKTAASGYSSSER
ncbi:MAG: LiaI-LiaF-like domain-containing protein [bacterium]